MSPVDEDLRERWEKKRPEIETRLGEFKRVRGLGEKRVFEELCFCLLTPQSSAVAADRAMRHLVQTGLLYSGAEDAIAEVVSGSGILYGDNKARFIVKARKELLDERTIALEGLLAKDAFEARERVVSNVKGLGYKEASHFLRNIGYEGLAILDRHILRTLCEAGVIECIPKTLSRKTYLRVEGEFLNYAKGLGIPSDALDMVMWSGKTGRIFK